MLKETDILEQTTETTDDVIDTLTKNQSSTSCSLTDIENMVQSLLASLPRLNRRSLRYEMSEMVVPMEKNPSTYGINEGLALSQGYRDRLSEILSYANAEFKLRKKCMEMLFDAINLISKASSADKRKGEAVMKYPGMVLQVESSEIFMKEVESIFNNMRATTDSISRQVSVMSIQVTLGERRQGNPNGKDIVPQSDAEEVDKGKSWDNF